LCSGQYFTDNNGQYMQARLEHILPRLLWRTVLQLTDIEMRQYQVSAIHSSAEINHAKLTSSSSRADCAAGTCAGSLCEVNDLSTYPPDSKCGSANSNKKCGGRWGDRCSTSTNTCGTGPSFCGASNCLYGNCTFTPPAPAPETNPMPFYYTGNTTDGFCGPNNDNKVCNVA
jgi:hypothetical protein